MTDHDDLNLLLRRSCILTQYCRLWALSSSLSYSVQRSIRKVSCSSVHLTFRPASSKSVGDSEELVWLEPGLGVALALPDIDELCELPQKSTLLGPYWTWDGVNE